MVVCPAPLTVKWQEEMATRFGLEFHIVDTSEVRRVRRERGLHANPFRVYPHTIVSLPWLRGTRCQRLLAEVLAMAAPAMPRAIDLLVVDEAHHCAPPGKGKVRGRQSANARGIPSVGSQRKSSVLDRDSAQRVCRVVDGVAGDGGPPKVRPRRATRSGRLKASADQAAEVRAHQA